MARYRRSDFRPALEWIDALPVAEREEIEAGAATTIRSLHLGDQSDLPAPKRPPEDPPVR